MAPARVSRSQHTATAAAVSSGEDELSQPGSQVSEDGKDRVSQMAEKMKKEVGVAPSSIR